MYYLIFFIFLAGCSKPSYIVDRVIDGDTIVVNGDVIRLSNIDTPEMDTLAGKLIAEYVRISLEGRIVELKGKGVGFYGRKLRYVYIDGINFNQHLLDKGYAKPYR